MKKLLLPFIASCFFPAANAQNCWQKVPDTPFTPIHDGVVLFEDVDGDGDMDVLLTGTTAYYKYGTYLYFNDGNGVYTEATNTPFASYNNVAATFADVDGDGDPDFLIAGAQLGQVIKLYLNDGKGVFTESQSNHGLLPVSLASFAFGDVDADGDLDLLLTGSRPNNGKLSALYRNDGTGNFTLDETQNFTQVSDGDLKLADLDNDGDLDLLLTGFIDSDGPNRAVTRLYINDGTGNFTLKVTGMIGVASNRIAISDVDLDGDLDIVLSGRINPITHATYAITSLYINDGEANFTAVSPSPFTATSNGHAVFADIDNDLDEDFLLTGFDSNAKRTTELYVNDGNGGFSLVENNPLPPIRTSFTSFADIDNDQDLDLLITGDTNTSSLYTTTLYLNCNGIVTSQKAGQSPNILIYPNPSSGIINLDLGDLPAGSIIRLLDLSGRILAEQAAGEQARSSMTINQPQGVYMVEVITNKDSYLYRIIKN